MKLVLDEIDWGKQSAATSYVLTVVLRDLISRALLAPHHMLHHTLHESQGAVCTFYHCKRDYAQGNSISPPKCFQTWSKKWCTGFLAQTFMLMMDDHVFECSSTLSEGRRWDPLDIQDLIHEIVSAFCKLSGGETELRKVQPNLVTFGDLISRRQGKDSSLLHLLRGCHSFLGVLRSGRRW